MTTQAIFNKAVKHLRQQGRKAQANGKCVYLAPNGDRCAVGCLISKRNYSPNMEGMGPSSLNYIGLLPKHLAEHISFLADLQTIHDDFDPEDWGTQLKVTAKEWGLKYPRLP